MPGAPKEGKEDSPDPEFQLSYNKWAQPAIAGEGETITYTLSFIRRGTPPTTRTWIRESVPTQLDFVDGSLSANTGTATYQDGRVHWTGLISAMPQMTITYQMAVPASEPKFIRNNAIFYNPLRDADPVIISTLIIIRGKETFLPLIIKKQP